jgi:hypothetical protein
MPRDIRRHAVAALGFALVTVLWLLPVIRRLSTAIPGEGPGDNITFLWNLWWMRYVLAHPGYSFFWTPFLFHPFGVDLTLHTHTALPALAAAVAGPSSLIVSQNVIVIAHVFLNFACCYALAYRATKNPIASAVAAAVFGCSPFVAARLRGHFNLIAAWIVPLVVLLWMRADQKRSIAAAALLGAASGAAAYVDYYLFVYASGVVMLLAFARAGQVRRARRTRLRRWALYAVVVVLMVDAGVVAWILATPRQDIHIGLFRVSIRTIDNGVTFGWIVILATLALTWRVRVRRESLVAEARVLLPALASALVVMAPLLFRAVILWQQGSYVSPQYRWRSAPAGIDVATLALGNPFNAIWGGRVRDVYAWLHVDLMERCGWIPAAAVVLSAAAVRARKSAEPLVSHWLFVSLVFAVWAMGPWLEIGGVRSPLALPAIGLRYVPLLENARIPGRAMVVVTLGVALLSAIGVARLAADPRRKRLAGLLIAVLAVDCAPAPTATYTLERPAVYETLKAASAPGAVCEVPLGLRDGFGETGRFDSNVLFYQTIHERPIVGGFVARLPPRVIREYSQMPIVGSLLRLSAGQRPDGGQRELAPDAAAAFLASTGIRYVVVNKRLASPDLKTYLAGAVRLTLLTEDESRSVYLIPSAGDPPDGRSNGPARAASQPSKELQHEVGVRIQAVLGKVRGRD